MTYEIEGQGLTGALTESAGQYTDTIAVPTAPGEYTVRVTATKAGAVVTGRIRFGVISPQVRSGAAEHV